MNGIEEIGITLPFSSTGSPNTLKSVPEYLHQREP